MDFDRIGRTIERIQHEMMHNPPTQGVQHNLSAFFQAVGMYAAHTVDVFHMQRWGEVIDFWRLMHAWDAWLAAHPEQEEE